MLYEVITTLKARNEYLENELKNANSRLSALKDIVDNQEKEINSKKSFF